MDKHSDFQLLVFGYDWEGGFGHALLVRQQNVVLIRIRVAAQNLKVRDVVIQSQTATCPPDYQIWWKPLSFQS